MTKRLGILVLAGCAYRPGSFSNMGRFPGTPLTLGCVDLAMERRSLATQPVIAYQFGNRCDHRVMVDLATIRVVARGHGSEQIALTPFDPNHEIRPLPLPARFTGRELIEYRDQDTRANESVCVDVGGVDGSIARSERWVCL